jgi:hypothetical protein
MTELMRFGSSLSGAQLRTFIEGHSTPTMMKLGIDLDLSTMHGAVAELSRDGDGAIDPSSDAVFAPVVHRTLEHLPQQHLLDHRFWQWLTCVEFRDYVRARWAPDVDFEVDATLKPSQQARFLGNAGLNGLGRNALSRLFWAAHVMQDANEDYALTKALFKKQDLSVGVIERSFGLIPAVARACARNLADLSEREHRDALKRLNLRSSTVVLEGASEEQVRQLLFG